MLHTELHGEKSFQMVSQDQQLHYLMMTESEFDLEFVPVTVVGSERIHEDLTGWIVQEMGENFNSPIRQTGSVYALQSWHAA